MNSIELRENGNLTQCVKSLHSIPLALPVPVAYADRTEVYQFNNAAHERWFNIPCESIAGQHIRKVLGDKIYKVVESRIKRALAGETCSCRLELPGGELGHRSVELHFAPRRDENDEVVGFYELTFDISARRHVQEERAKRETLEAQLLELNKRQRSVFDLLLVGKTSKAISHELDVSMRTVERARHDIVERLNVASINEMLVKFADLAPSSNSSTKIGNSI